MDQSAKALSRTLDGLSRALAEWTVTRHAEQDSSLPGRYGDAWHDQWVAAVYSRLEYLSQSIAVRRPAVFAGMISWEASAYRAREAPLEDLIRSLECLQSVLISELPHVADKINTYLSAGLVLAKSPACDAISPSGLEGPHAAITLSYLEAILASHSDEALRLILRHAQSGLPVRELYRHVLGPAMAEIGNMWHRGEITVADEHMATATTQLALSGLRVHFPQRTLLKNKRAVAATLAGDYHELGLRMAADLLEMEGWDVVYIGTNTPASEIIGFLEREPASVLMLGIGSCLHLRAAGELIENVNTQLGKTRPQVLIGGPPLQMVEDLWKELGADACAHRLEDIPALASQLVSRGCA